MDDQDRSGTPSAPDPTEDPTRSMSTLPTPPAPPPQAAPPPQPAQTTTGWDASPPPAAPQVGWAPPQEAEGPAPGIEFAPHGGRLVAYIIDGLIVGLVVSVLVIVGLIVLFGGVSIDQSTGQVTDISGASVGSFLLLLMVATIIGLLYFPFFWARGGQTPGMRPFSLHVVRDSDGAAIGWGTALLRLIGLAIIDSIVFGLPIGLVWVFIDKRRRAWHDLIASTVVIKRP